MTCVILFFLAGGVFVDDEGVYSNLDDGADVLSTDGEIAGVPRLVTLSVISF